MLSKVTSTKERLQAGFNTGHGETCFLLEPTCEGVRYAAPKPQSDSQAASLPTASSILMTGLMSKSSQVLYASAVS